MAEWPFIFWFSNPAGGTSHEEFTCYRSLVDLLLWHVSSHHRNLVVNANTMHAWTRIVQRNLQD
jgi:hypothetical protein